GAALRGRAFLRLSHDAAERTAPAMRWLEAGCVRAAMPCYKLDRRPTGFLGRYYFGRDPRQVQRSTLTFTFNLDFYSFAFCIVLHSSQEDREIKAATPRARGEGPDRLIVVQRFSGSNVRPDALTIKAVRFGGFGQNSVRGSNVRARMPSRLYCKLDRRGPRVDREGGPTVQELSMGPYSTADVRMRVGRPDFEPAANSVPGQRNDLASCRTVVGRLFGRQPSHNTPEVTGWKPRDVGSASGAPSRSPPPGRGGAVASPPPVRPPPPPPSALQPDDDDDDYRRLAAAQSSLLDEASSLTRSLYRRCLRSASVLSCANERDENDFREREEAQRRGLEDFTSSSAGPISMAPPVDRDNELRSRGGYYRSFARENFDGHWDLLGEHGFHIGAEGGSGAATTTMTPRPWREEQVEQFAYLIRTGEESRRYVLRDYGFADPCTSDGWPSELEGRLGRFVARSSELTRESYGRRGWVHSSSAAFAGGGDPGPHDEDDDDGDFDSDDEG
ncbi:hypothetical protein THAOC_06070, partial [Thalassiosira oceanica]